MSNKVTIAVLIVGLALASGCKSELDDQAAAKVNEPAAEQKADEAKADKAADKKAAKKADQPSLREIAVSTKDSSIGWVGAKVTGDHTGGFKKFEGKLWEKNGEVEKVAFTVDTTSVFSDTEKLTNHLKSADFFEVDKYPEATFISKKIVEKKSTVERDDKKFTFSHQVTGDFTIHGVTKELTFPANIKAGEDKLEASTQFTFNRFDFDIVYKGKPDDLIRKEVLLKVALVAPLEKAAKAKAAAAE